MSEHREYVMGFVLTGTGWTILAVKDGEGPDGRGLNGVGGKVEPGETPAKAMAREWAEETGCEPQAWAEAGTMGSAREGWTCHLFVSRPATLPRGSGGDALTVCHSVASVFDLTARDDLYGGPTRMMRVALAMALEGDRWLTLVRS